MMAVTLQLCNTLPLDGITAKPQNTDAETIQPVSFDEILKVEEKKLQQETNVLASAALLSGMLPPPFIPESIPATLANTGETSISAGGQAAPTMDPVQLSDNSLWQNVPQPAFPQSQATNFPASGSTPQPAAPDTQPLDEFQSPKSAALPINEDDQTEFPNTQTPEPNRSPGPSVTRNQSISYKDTPRQPQPIVSPGTARTADTFTLSEDVIHPSEINEQPTLVSTTDRNIPAATEPVVFVSEQTQPKSINVETRQAEVSAPQAEVKLSSEPVPAEAEPSTNTPVYNTEPARTKPVRVEAADSESPAATVEVKVNGKSEPSEPVTLTKDQAAHTESVDVNASKSEIPASTAGMETSNISADSDATIVASAQTASPEPVNIEAIKSEVSAPATATTTNSQPVNTDTMTSMKSDLNSEPAKVDGSRSVAAPAEIRIEGADPSQVQEEAGNFQGQGKSESDALPGATASALEESESIKVIDAPEVMATSRSANNNPFVDTFRNVQTTQTQPLVSEVIQKVISQVKTRVKNGETSMRMQLNPSGLGAINIEMVSDAQGLRIHFVTEQAGTARMLEAQSEQLRQSLQDAGVQLANLNVSQHNTPRQEGGFFRQEQSFTSYARSDSAEREEDVKNTVTPSAASLHEVDYLV